MMISKEHYNHRKRMVESKKPTKVAATIIDYIANIQLNARSGDRYLREGDPKRQCDDTSVYQLPRCIQIFIATPNTTAYAQSHEVVRPIQPKVYHHVRPNPRKPKIIRSQSGLGT
jgi:hypothetical protein